MARLSASHADHQPSAVHYLQVYIIYYCEPWQTTSSAVCFTASRAMPQLQQQAVLLLLEAQSKRFLPFYIPAAVVQLMVGG
jgi:hypothetical protein